jgi:4-amino-4-deoxy-L-arabinose transferase-like glycosyltransferase
MNKNFARLPQAASPTEGWPLALVLGLFLVIGTFQHDPWKNEDAAHFGIIWRALQSGDWLYLHFSSGTQAETPLYYWLGGLCAHFLQSLIGAANAARLASTLMVALALTALYRAARNLYGKDLAPAAPLTLIGCLGFLVASHDTQPVTATVAGICLLLFGLTAISPPAGLINRPAAPTGRAVQAALLGITLGLAFILLSSGLRLLPALLIASLGLLWHPARRTLVWLCAVGLLLAGALLAAWYLQLRALHPEVAGAWLTQQTNLLTLRGLRPEGNALVTASWFTWPAWPLAALALWKQRHRLSQPALLVPGSLSLALLLAIFLSGETRQAWLATILPGLALLAVSGIRAMRRGHESLLDWFGRMTFIVILVILWAGWSAMTFGWPTKWAQKSALLAPGFAGSFEPLPFIIALVATAAWLWICFFSQRSPLKSLFSWTGGMILFWLITTTLWLPWIDHQRNYRGLSNAVATRVATPNCISTSNMGEAQFASFDYFLAVPLKREMGNPTCRYLLQQGTRQDAPGAGGNWQKIWEGQRPGDKVERYRLYQR